MHPSDQPPTAVLVAPHPDDEVFGAGALLRWLVACRHRVRVIAVTDGEAAWGDLAAGDRQDLARRRAAERARALTLLGVGGHIEVVRLGIPDGAVADHEDELTARLAEIGAPLMAATWRNDGHPDHEAVGRAAAVAAGRLDASLVEFVVWAGLRQRLTSRQLRTARIVPMSAATRAAKLRAAAAFRSQLEPSPDGRPVVPQALIDRLAVEPEVVLT